MGPPFGDRKTEIVIIGQDLDELHIRQELDACLVPAHLLDVNWEEGYMDEWPVERGQTSVVTHLWTQQDEAEHPRPRFGEVNDTR